MKKQTGRMALIMVLLMTVTCLTGCDFLTKMFNPDKGEETVTTETSDETATGLVQNHNTVIDASYKPAFYTVASNLVRANEGGVVEADANAGYLKNMSVSIPAGALSEDKVISINQMFNQPPAEELYPVIAFDLGPDGTVFNQPITVTFSYSDQELELSGVEDESQLKLYYYNDSTQQWILVPDIQVYPNQNKVVGSLTHFSKYALMKNDPVPAYTNIEPIRGDLLFRKSKMFGKNIWAPAHVGIFIEKRDGKYIVIEAINGERDENKNLTGKSEVVWSEYSTLSEFATRYDTVFMGVRRPKNFEIDTIRQKIVDYAKTQANAHKQYALNETKSYAANIADFFIPYSGLLLTDNMIVDFIQGIERAQFVKGSAGKYNCVGLVEAAFEDADANGGTGFFSTAKESIMLTPYLMYRQTVPAEGLPGGSGEQKVSGIVRDAYTNIGLGGVRINVYNEDLSQVTYGINDYIGNYEISIPSDGTYTLEFSHDQYKSTWYYGVIVENGLTTYLSPVMKINLDQMGDGNVSGLISDSTTGSGIAGVSVKLRPGLNQTALPVAFVASTNTNTSGNYFFNDLPAGNYTAQLTKTGYSNVFFNITCIGGVPVTGQNASMSSTIVNSQLRVVMSWGTSPADLDSHLSGPDGSGGRFHVYYHNKIEENVALDIDDQDGVGPETVTADGASSGLYTYWVHNYSNRSSSNSRSLADSGVRIDVYFNGQMKTFYPPSQAGTLWKVFEINNGTIVSKNQMMYESDSSVAYKTSSNYRTIDFGNLPAK